MQSVQSLERSILQSSVVHVATLAHGHASRLAVLGARKGAVVSCLGLALFCVLLAIHAILGLHLFQLLLLLLGANLRL